MKNVSDAWKETIGCYDHAQRPRFVPISFVEIEYVAGDPNAQANAASSDNGSMDYANTEQIVKTGGKSFVKFATLEHNMWELDGEWDLRHEIISQDVGFTSSVICDESCLFGSRPIITISFDKVYETITPGISIIWSTAYKEMANRFIVHIYNGTKLVDTIEIDNNTDVETMIEHSITGFDKIDIEIVEWCLPYHRARIENIFIGAHKIYDKSDLMGYNHEMSSDLLSFELPENVISFSLDNIQEEWNPNNPAGLSKYLIERQRLTVRYGYKINGAVEWFKAGTFYMSEWGTPSNGISASFTAASIVDFMENAYSVPENTTLTLYDLATDAFIQANLPLNDDGSVKWHISEKLKDITIVLPDEFNVTCAEVIQLCSNASCCVMKIDQEGDLHIETLSGILTDYLIDQFVSYKNHEYSLSKPLGSVDVNNGLGTVKNDISGEVQKVDNILIQNSTVANAVAEWVNNVLSNRKTLRGEFRADPRLDVLDKIIAKNKYAINEAFVTSFKLTYNGAFKGHFEGRVIE